jgi:hypothetical protein
MPAEVAVKYFFCLVNIFSSGEQASCVFCGGYGFAFGVAALINVVYPPPEDNIFISSLSQQG